ncbi:MAG: peptidoglycan binding protein CsiV [Gammaproteobacteria bacterium]|nr:peptidoglycan binding protein CsiV [Gammaproteobacteria bacterium]
MLNLIRLLVLCLVIAAPTVNAEDTERRYEIETIIVRALNHVEGNELWPLEPPAELRVSARAENRPNPIQRYLSPKDDASLASISQKIAESGDYEILESRRWVQVADARSQSPAAEFKLQVDAIGVLEGYIQFYMSRFLHVDVSLDLIPPNHPQSSTDPETGPRFAVYRIDEDRRIKSETWYYFDHPAFGVLVYVKPV